MIVLEPAGSIKSGVPALEQAVIPAVVRLTGSDSRAFRGLGWTGDPVAEWGLSGGRARLDSIPPDPWDVQVVASDGRSWSGRLTAAPGVETAVALE
jgi:hypothetical protein